MRESSLLTPARPRTLVATVTLGIALGFLSSVGITSAAPAHADDTERAVTDAATTELERAELEAALDAGRDAVVDAISTEAAVADAGLDLGEESTDVDTVDLHAVLDAVSEADPSSAVVPTLLGEIADAERSAVEAETTALQERLDAAIAQREAELAAERAAAAALAAANTPDGARKTARTMAAERYGWGDGQFSCLSSLWQKESGWNYQAYNPSGATGIPQALPGSKMATAGGDWQTNAATQIRWGLDYIKRAYGTPCAAWGHSQSVNWY